MLTQDVVVDLPGGGRGRPALVHLHGARRRLGHPGGRRARLRRVQRPQRVGLGHGQPHGARARHLLDRDGGGEERLPLLC